ncbi:UNKNOWN [Stylonychia lemnae]|uniref:Uncharacterized protein n=1 Tax=Stylonychia lemnae TaxID=5949 RepID=A0A078A165_STYLE|nr:UNKNOWN [Stylonychia lemnae]|eukprot:CDW75592.1 UNKNOWN [Stylonychia lemnae]
MDQSNGQQFKYRFLHRFFEGSDKIKVEIRSNDQGLTIYHVFYDEKIHAQTSITKVLKKILKVIIKQERLIKSNQIAKHEYKLTKVEILKINASNEYQSVKLFENQEQVDQMKLEDLKPYGDMVDLYGVWNFEYYKTSACCSIY